MYRLRIIWSDSVLSRGRHLNCTRVSNGRLHSVGFLTGVKYELTLQLKWTVREERYAHVVERGRAQFIDRFSALAWIESDTCDAPSIIVVHYKHSCCIVGEQRSTSDEKIHFFCNHSIISKISLTQSATRLHRALHHARRHCPVSLPTL